MFVFTKEQLDAMAPEAHRDALGWLRVEFACVRQRKISLEASQRQIETRAEELRDELSVVSETFDKLGELIAACPVNE